MRRTLKLHPASRCAAVNGIAVEADQCKPGVLALRFAVEGRIAGIALPPLSKPERTDELWRHSCFEAFLRHDGGKAYYEFNFAPSGQWAAYRFTDYRSGMSPAEEMDPPQIERTAEKGMFELRASLELGPLPDLPSDGTWQLGLSAVIEAADGNLSYWALAHPPGKPDFHHSDCFVMELPAALRP